MNDWVILVIVSTFIGALVPKGQGGGLKKTMTFLMGILFLSSVAAPFAKVITGLSDMPERLSELLVSDGSTMESEARDARDWVIRHSVENIETKVNALLAYRYGLRSDQIVTEAFTETNEVGNVLLTELRIHVGQEVDISTYEIERYIGDILACPAVVIRSENKEERA